jgi:peptide/nickel transport system substrate-binding protein
MLLEARNEVWNYPERLIPFLKKNSIFFLILISVIGGIVLGLFATSLFTLQKASAFSHTVYREGVVGRVRQLSPLIPSNTSYENEVAQLIYSPLIRLDAAGKIYPNLSDAWAISGDGKSYTFYLRKNVQWHDGEPFTADDVKVTFELLKAGGKNAVNGDILSDVEIKVVDKFTIQFTLPQSNASFLEMLMIGIIPAHLYKDYTYARYADEVTELRPIGTGPYRFVQRRGKTLVFAANDKYFLQKPKIPTIEISEYLNEDQAIAALLRTEIYTLINVPPEKVQQFEKYSHLKVKKYSLANNTRLIYFNTDKPEDTLKEPVRKAIASAIDKFELTQFIPGAEIAYGPYAQTSWVYNEKDQGLINFDVEASRKRLLDAGWKIPDNSKDNIRYKGDTRLLLTLSYLETDTNKIIAEQIRLYMKTIGVDIAFKPLNREELIQQVLPNRDFEMLIFEVQTSIDPDLYTLWHSSQEKYPGLNISGYTSAEVDGYLERARVITNRDRRLQEYRSFQETLITDVPVIFLYHPPFYEIQFDIITKPAEDEYLLPAERFTDIHLWEIEPRWRNWQTR